MWLGMGVGNGPRHVAEQGQAWGQQQHCAMPPASCVQLVPSIGSPIERLCHTALPPSASHPSPERVMASSSQG